MNMKKKARQRHNGNGNPTWDRALDQFNFEFDKAPIITMKDIDRLPKHIERLLPEGKSPNWLMPLYSAIQRTMCRQCEKNQLTLPDLCVRLITITKIISSYGKKAEPKIFLGWLRKSQWNRLNDLPIVSAAVQGIYKMPAKTLHEGWHLEVFLGLMAKAAFLVARSKDGLFMAVSAVGKFIFHNQNIVEMIRAVGVPKNQLKCWVDILVWAENS